MVQTEPPSTVCDHYVSRLGRTSLQNKHGAVNCLFQIFSQES